MNLSKLKFLIFASFITLIFIGCSSEQETLETLQNQSTTINLDNSLDEAIENSLDNYQAVVIVFYRGYFWGICRAQLGELAQNHDLFRRFGIDIIAQAVGAPLRQMAFNAGLSSDLIEAEVKSTSENSGYNFRDFFHSTVWVDVIT